MLLVIDIVTDVYRNAVSFIRHGGLLMIWLSIVVVSAISVEYSVLLTRQKFHQLQNYQESIYNLQKESSQLLLEKSMMSRFDKIKKISREKFNLVVPSSEQIEIIYP